MADMQTIYVRINWENQPSSATALGATNLNKMDLALSTIDGRVVSINTTKLDVATANTMVQNVTVDANGVFTITKLDGTVTTYDTKIEKIAVNFAYDEATQRMVLTLEDGTKQYVDLSSLVTDLDFTDSDTIDFTVTNGVVSAIVKNGSITGEKLQPNYLADVTVQSQNASNSASSALDSKNESTTQATKSQSYAVGGTGTRTGEDTDNAKYYKEQAKQIAGITTILNDTTASANQTYSSSKIEERLNNDLNAVVADGTGTDITLQITSMEAYIPYRIINFIAKANNNGAATTININSIGAKNLYKPNTTVAPTLTAGKAYTVWYNGTDFFIKASAEGTAVAANVLAGTTFSNDSDVGIQGGMVERGAVTITPGTTNQTISEGHHNGSGYVLGDPDLVQANIKAGANIFGVAGDSNVVDTSDANLEASKMLSGQNGCSKGLIVKGEIVESANGTLYCGGEGVISITQHESSQYHARLLAKAPYASNNRINDATQFQIDIYNLIASNIKKGVVIGNIVGTLDNLEHVTVTTTNSGFISSGKINGTIGTELSVIKYVTIKAYGGYSGTALITLTATDASGYYSASIDSSNVGHSGSIAFSGGNITFNNIYQVLFGAGNYVYTISETYPMTIEVYGS